MEKPILHRGQHHHRPAADLPPLQEPLSASQPSNTTLPTSTTCSALACTTTARKGPGMVGIFVGFAALCHSCLDAAASHTAAPGNGHCSTKLTVHLLLAADAAESGL